MSARDERTPRTPRPPLRRRLAQRLRGTALVRRVRPVARYQDLRDRVYVRVRGLPFRELYPHFLIIGAQKAGTSSLHYYLDQHPGIFMTSFKETNLFLDDSDRLGDYHALEPHFYGSSSRDKRGGLSDDQILRRMLRGYRGEATIGDASPYYACAPWAGCEVPARARRARPEMKIVYLLRNPLDRLVSNHLHDVSIHAGIGQPIAEPLDARVASRPHLLDISLYWMQLERYLQVFPPAQIQVIVFEELLADPGSTLRRLCAFLGADPDVAFDTSRIHNPSAVRDRVAPEETRLSERSYAQLIEPIRRDLAHLERFLGRDLSLWDLSPERWCR